MKKQLIPTGEIDRLVKKYFKKYNRDEYYKELEQMDDISFRVYAQDTYSTHMLALKQVQKLHNLAGRFNSIWSYLSPTYFRLRELAREKNEKSIKSSIQLSAFFDVAHKKGIDVSELVK